MHEKVTQQWKSTLREKKNNNKAELRGKQRKSYNQK